MRRRGAEHDAACASCVRHASGFLQAQRGQLSLQNDVPWRGNWYDENGMILN